MAAEDPEQGSGPSSSERRSSTEGGLWQEILVAASFLGWAICFKIAMRVTRAGVVTSLPLAWLIAAVPSLAAVGILVGYIRYLRKIDELQRLIQMQAMGWAFGGGFFAICGYLLFVPLGAPDVDTATIATIMPVLFAVGTLMGAWRYR